MSQDIAVSPVRWWTCFLGHRWGQWEVTKVTAPATIADVPEVERWITRNGQARNCLRCGYRVLAPVCVP